MAKVNATIDQIRIGFVSTHYASQIHRDPEGNEHAQFKSSVFVEYVNGKGEKKCKNSGVSTPMTPDQTRAIEEGRQLAHSYSIPYYDVGIVSFHNKPKPEFVAKKQQPQVQRRLVQLRRPSCVDPG